MIDLTQLGFYYVGKCNCNGTTNLKYKRGEWLIYITKTKFKAKKNGATVKSYTDLQYLETYLYQAIQGLPAREQISN